MSNKSVLINDRDLFFREEDHKYFLDGVETISVTTLLKEQHITEDLSGKVDEEYLKLCAEHGNIVHTEIETFVNSQGKINGITDDVEWFKNHIYPMCPFWYAEEMLNTEDYAGKCDLWGIKDNGTVVVIDTKTGTVNRNAVAWQTTLYYLGLVYNKKVLPTVPVEFYCFDAKGEESRLISLDKISQVEVNKLLNCHRTGTIYEAPFLPMDIADEEKALMFEQKIAAFKTLENDYKKFKDNLKNKMLESGINSIKGKNITISLTEYETIRFNESLFKQKCPKLYPKYMNKVVSQTRLNIKVSKEQEA